MCVYHFKIFVCTYIYIRYIFSILTETLAFLSSFLFLSSFCPDEALTLPSFTRVPGKWSEGTGKSQDTASKAEAGAGADRPVVCHTCGVSLCVVCVLRAWAIICTCALYTGRGWSGYRVLSMVCACVMSISGALSDICQTRFDMGCRLSMHLWWG